MRIRGPFKLKRKLDDESDAIVLTFNQRWLEPLTYGRVSVVFRKSGPTDFTPQLVYAYIAAPTSSIAFRMEITSYSSMPVEATFELADAGAISKSDLKSYAGSNHNLVVMRIGQIFVAELPITCDFLAQNFNFWPSSTYIPLSSAGVATLDELGHFKSITPTTSRLLHDR